MIKLKSLTLALALSCAALACTTPEHHTKQEPPKLRTMPMDASLQQYDPASPAGAQLDWVLKAINQERGEVSLAQIDARFDPSFTAQLHPAQLQQTLSQLSATLAPLTPSALIKAEPHHLIIEAKTTAAQAWRVELVTTHQAPNLITALLFQPVEPPETPTEPAEPAAPITPESAPSTQ